MLVLEPGRAERHYWRDLWAYRELFAILAWRDVAVRYKQTVIGVAWAVVRPFLTMVIFTIVFGRLADLPSEGAAPYPIMVFAGMLPWFLFSSILSEASNSLVGNANLIGKVYFPRIIIPASSAVVALVDFGINLVMLAGADGLVRLRAELASAAAAGLRDPGRAGEPRSGPLHHRAQCEIPRLPLHHSVHRAVRALCLAGRLLERGGAGAMALLVQPQSGGRRHRRLPLVRPRRRVDTIPAGLSVEPWRRRAVPVARHRLFPAHRAHLRGSDLMAGDVVIRAEGLGKKYIIGHETERERYTALRDVAARTARNVWKRAVDAARGRAIVRGEATEEFWALKDVSFEVKRGEVLGIIGRNGAGKSTLLKILSRITEPSEGRVTIAGRVASLLEVGTGFHPELTGRENIYLNGAILGMSRAEIRRKFDEIVAFAEVEKFLDTPVKRYSSGMYVRLAFAVAAHLEPEILVVDEVLAVGDAEFQKKCLGKMGEVAERGGRTVLFVSHNMAAVQSLCERVIHLENGKSKLMVMRQKGSRNIFRRLPSGKYSLKN